MATESYDQKQFNEAYKKYYDEGCEESLVYVQTHILTILERAKNGLYSFSDMQHEEAYSATLPKMLEMFKDKKVKPQNPAGLVFTAYKNALHNANRKKREGGLGKAAFYIPDGSSHTDRLVGESDAREALRKAVEKIKNEDSKNTYLDYKFWDERGFKEKPKYKDLAEKYDVPEGTIKSRIHSASNVVKLCIHARYNYGVGDGGMSR